MKKGAQARRSEQNARRRRGKREDGIAAVTNERTNGRATLARAASARVDEMVRGEQSIRHHAFLLSARAQCVLYIPRAAVLLLLDRAKAENAPSFLLLVRRPFRYLRYSDTDSDVARAFPSPSIATTRYNAISRVESEKQAAPAILSSIDERCCSSFTIFSLKNSIRFRISSHPSSLVGNILIFFSFLAIFLEKHLI